MTSSSFIVQKGLDIYRLVGGGPYQAILNSIQQIAITQKRVVGAIAMLDSEMPIPEEIPESDSEACKIMRIIQMMNGVGVPPENIGTVLCLLSDMGKYMEGIHVFLHERVEELLKDVPADISGLTEAGLQGILRYC